MAARLALRKYAKKEYILTKGKVENFVSFLDSGIIRFFVAEPEKEITFEIGFENGFVTAYDSFLTRRPVDYEVQALTDCLLWSISYEDLQELYQHTQSGNRVGRLAAERLYIEKGKRQMTLLKDTAEQRYTRLITEYPHLIRFIPGKYLASYIGITPQALSRIRKRIS